MHYFPQNKATYWVYNYSNASTLQNLSSVFFAPNQIYQANINNPVNWCLSNVHLQTIWRFFALWLTSSLWLCCSTCWKFCYFTLLFCDMKFLIFLPIWTWREIFILCNCVQDLFCSPYSKKKEAKHSLLMCSNWSAQNTYAI